MFSDQHFAEVGEIGECVIAQKQLMGIGPAVGANGDSLAAPDELGPAGTEMPPAPPRQLAGPTVARAVPALHRQDGEAIANPNAVYFIRLRQRGIWAATQFLIERDGDAQRRQMSAEILCGFKLCDAAINSRHRTASNWDRPKRKTTRGCIDTFL